MVNIDDFFFLIDFWFFCTVICICINGILQILYNIKITV